MMYHKLLLLFCSVFLLVQTGNSQERVVNGIVTAYGKIPLNKVSLVLNNSEKEILSDSKGFFSFTCHNREKVTVSAKGFYTQKIKVADLADEDSLHINLRLKNGKKNFQYATGYGYISEKELTYAIQHLEDDPGFSSYSSILEAIQGRVSGVSVSGNSIIIRGSTTLNGAVPALLVVDGAVVDFPVFVGIPTIEIKSIDVLKSAAASSQYGSRGMGGVVVVETKSIK